MTVVELTDMDFSKAIMKINLKGFQQMTKRQF